MKYILYIFTKNNRDTSFIYSKIYDRVKIGNVSFILLTFDKTDLSCPKNSNVSNYTEKLEIQTWNRNNDYP